MKFVEIIQHMVNLGILITIYSMSNKNFNYFKKKSLCAECAEANSERNLYNPPQKVCNKAFTSCKGVIFSGLLLHLKFNIKTLLSQI